MKKYLCLSLATLLLSSCFFGRKNVNTDAGQQQIIDQTEKTEFATWLNKEEAEELNKIFAAYRNDFDFTSKRVIFFTGSSGKLRSSKEHYFRMQKKYDNTSYYNRDNGYLYIFDEDQKKAVGGYDAAIVFWTKSQWATEDVMDRIMLEPPIED